MRRDAAEALAEAHRAAPRRVTKAPPSHDQEARGPQRRPAPGRPTAAAHGSGRSRRSFSEQYKQRVLAEAAAAGPEEFRALLERERLTAAHLRRWQHAPVSAPALPRPRGATQSATVEAPTGPRHPWRYRATILIGLLIGIICIRLIREMVWPTGRIPVGPAEKILSYGPILWALPALPAAFALLGFMLYPGLTARSRGPRGRKASVPSIETMVCFRIVTRGDNLDALCRSVEAVLREMASLPAFRHCVEVVTERRLPLPTNRRVRQLVVPEGYETPNGSRYKARALQYALDASPLHSDAWIMHLDEESRITPSLIIGVRDAVSEEEASGRHRIGQGAILYHADLDRHPLLTLADMIRTGDDLGRFYLQHRLGFTIFGLHGSFVLVRASVEREVGFDFGPEGSITEDAYWAVQQMGRGRRCRWVEGFLLEQSTRSLADFIKQRRRWFAGMLRTVLYAPTPVWIRFPLAVFTALWAVSWLSMTYTVVNIFVGLRTPVPLSVLGDFAYTTYLITYLLGLTVNLRERGSVGRPRRALLYFLQVVLLPVFTLLEAGGVVAGLVRAERGFHVVRK